MPELATPALKPPLYLGGLASCLAALFTHPLDLLKVRLQTFKGTPGAARPGVVSVLGFSLERVKRTLTRLASRKVAVYIARHEGLIHLYDGLSASLLRQGTYSTVRFGSYDVLKNHFGITERCASLVVCLLYLVAIVRFPDLLG